MEDKIGIEFEGHFEGDVMKVIVTIELKQPLEMLSEEYSNKLSSLYNTYRKLNFIDYEN